MDGSDVALLVLSGYVALVALVRLMIRRRDQLVDEFRRKLRAESKRIDAENEQRQRARRQQAA